MKYLQHSALFSGLAVLLFGLTRVAQATTHFDPEGVFATSGVSTASPTAFIFAIISSLLGFLAVITLVLIIYSGVTIMTAAGNEERVQKGTATLRWTIIGLLIIMSSWGIVLYLNSVITRL